LSVCFVFWMGYDIAMQVDLLYPDEDTIRTRTRELIYLAARTCYSSLTPQQIWERIDEIDERKIMSVVQHVVASGHHSTLEHLSYTFGISGVSRALTHQLVRHRIGVAYDQQSQRYVRFGKGLEDLKDGFVVPPSVQKNPDALEEYYRVLDEIGHAYDRLVELGVPVEDARYLLPNAAKTNLVMTVNLRQLMHMSGLRLCVLAQWEIRDLFKRIRKILGGIDPIYNKLLVPKCVPMGHCNEERNKDGWCKIRPYKQSGFRLLSGSDE